MHGRRLFGALLALCTLCGCEIGNTMFQMDSNSGRPFFGVDLLPARKKTAQATPGRADATLAAGRDSHVVKPVANRLAGGSQPVATVVTTESPSLFDRLKWKRQPERVALTLSAAADDTDLGPAETFR
jgi:hypothetical protein